MTTVRVTTRTYDVDSGELAREVEIEITTPDIPAKPKPAPPKPTVGFGNVVSLRPALDGCPPDCPSCARFGNVVSLRPALDGCPPDCPSCARDAARSFGFQIRYTPTPPPPPRPALSPVAWVRYSTPISVKFTDALARVFV